MAGMSVLRVASARRRDARRLVRSPKPASALTWLGVGVGVGVGVRVGVGVAVSG